MVKRSLRTAAIFLAVSLLYADTVVFTTPHGKTYHARKECMSLLRSKSVVAGPLEAATAKGLRACGICSRRKKEAK